MQIIEQYDEDDTRVSAALSEGFCPDCHSPLTKCMHQLFHIGRGDDQVFGDCGQCRACWTFGPTEILLS